MRSAEERHGRAAEQETLRQVQREWRLYNGLGLAIVLAAGMWGAVGAAWYLLTRWIGTH